MLNTDFDNLDLAIQISSLGWKVFPCGQDKSPLVPVAHPKGDPLYKVCRGGCGKLGHGYHDAVTGFDAVYDLWEKAKAPSFALVGIACAPSGLLVIDLDCHPGRPNGLESFAEIVAKNGAKLPECGAMQKTAGGGFHLVYKMPRMDSAWEIPAILAPGIDLKYNGYICTGTLQDGRAYQWVDGYNYDNKLCPPPIWVLTAIAKRNAPKPITEPRRAFASTGEEVERVRAALGRIAKYRADDYHDWLHIGFALRSLGAAGLDLWHEFSKQSPKYDAEVLDKKWNTFGDSGITVSTIFWMAKHDNA